MGIYRLPPVIIGEKPFTASAVKERIDWGLAALNVPAHWARTQGAGIRIGVCDTGRYVHPDIAPPVLSKNFSTSKNDLDRDGHSTHVCGIIAAKKDGKGVVGVAPKVELVTCKVLGDDGSGTYASVVAGIDYCVENKCHIISMSLGGPWDSDLRRACSRANDAGVFIIAAAGNDGTSNSVNYPAKFPWPVAVAAYNRNGQIAEFSSRGPEVDIAFPGEQILSTWLNKRYNVLSGTSMATPFCSGLIALMLSIHKSGKPGVTPITNSEELLEHIRRNTIDKGKTGRDNAWGWGIPNIDGFLYSSVPGKVVPRHAVVTDEEVIIGKSGRTVVFNAEYKGKYGTFIYNE